MEMATVGKRLKAWRKSLPLTLAELSRKVGVSPGSLSDLENDKSQPSAKTLANLNRHFGMDIGWLLTGKEFQASLSEEKTIVSSGTSPLHQDKKLNEMVQLLIRNYQNGDPRDISFLSGFLFGMGTRWDNQPQNKSSSH